MPNAQTREKRRGREADAGQRHGGNDGRSSASERRLRKAIIGAVVAATGGATTVAAKKVIADRRAGTEKRASADGGPGDRSLRSAVLSSSWEAARDSLLPLLEDMAERLGSYAATASPELVRHRLLPAFVAAFDKGRDRGGGD